MESDVELSPLEPALFQRLNHSFLVFVARETGTKPSLRTPDDYLKLSADEKEKVNEAYYDNTQLLEKFLQSNPFRFTSEELEIVKSWKYYLRGTFLLIRYTKGGAIFLEEEDESVAKAYLVMSLVSRFEEMMPFRPPVRIETVLLPFKEKIVYDGVLHIHPDILWRQREPFI